MTDFLHRLAFRTLAPERLVRPRVPSLFEQIEGAAPGALVQEDAFEEALEVDSQRPDRRSLDSARAATSAHETKVDPPHAAPGLSAPPVTVPPEPPTRAGRDGSRVERLPVARRFRTKGPPRQEPVHEGLPPTPHEAAPVPEPARLEPLAASRPKPPRPLSSWTATSQERPSAPAPATLEHAPDIRRWGRAPVSVEASVRPERPTRSVPRGAQRQQEPEPRIHVSIGRVEVRAVSPPAAPRKRAPESPPGKRLDEYLRERDGAR